MMGVSMDTNLEQTSITPWTHKVHLVLCSCIVFMMPLYQKAIPSLIFLMALNWAVERALHGFKGLVAARVGISMVALYLLYGLGLLWTNNLSSGFFDMEVKLSFLIMPLIFCTRPPMTRKQMRLVITIFVIGLAAAIGMCLGHSYYRYLYHKSFSFHFFERYFVFHMHLGYFAMMINLGLCLLLAFLVREGRTLSNWKRIGIVFLLIWFSFSVIQTGSKNGILTLVVIYIVFAIWWTVRTRKWLVGAGGLVIVAGSFIFTLMLSERVFYRFEAMWQSMNEVHDPTTIESTAIRSFAWESALEIIKENFVNGVGTGDVKESLLAKYKIKGYTGALKRNINAHNQFYQTGIALGVPGLLAIGFLFFAMLQLAWRERKALLACLGLIMLLYAITESVFEVQAGVVFFTFFTMMLASGQHFTIEKEELPENSVS